MKKWFSVLVGALMLSAGTVQAGEYVGSAKCFSCHADQFNLWQASGHPWKLRKAEKARSAKLPLPPGYAWEDISYVIGGAMKKARYIDLNGYIITAAKDGSEAKTQYNIEDGSWSFYQKGQKQPYKCGPCHMTAYNSEGHQDGKEGLIGTWKEDGIGCEECHGPGSDHLKTPNKQTVTIDKSAKACGKCHQRGGINPQPIADKGFIQHHEQINELLAGPHSALACTECHNPHQRAIVIKTECATCHEEIAKSFSANVHSKAGKGCIECHMAKVSKSAIAPNTYTGDVRTHIFKITTDPEATMFTEVEKNGKKVTYAKDKVTLDYACLSCHGTRDKAWAAKNAKNFHGQK